MSSSLSPNSAWSLGSRNTGASSTSILVLAEQRIAMGNLPAGPRAPPMCPYEDIDVQENFHRMGR